MAIKARIVKVTDKDNKLLGFKYRVKGSVDVGRTGRKQTFSHIFTTKKEATKFVKNLK